MIKSKKIISCFLLPSILVVTGCASTKSTFVEKQYELSNASVCRNYLQDEQELVNYIEDVDSLHEENKKRNKNKYHNPRFFYREEMDPELRRELVELDSEYLNSLSSQINIRDLDREYCDTKTNKYVKKMQSIFSWRPF